MQDNNMRIRKLLVIPGTTSPLFTTKYKNAYATIKKGAELREVEYHIIYYPGQEGRTSGLMTYEGQLESVLSACSHVQPDWLIGLCNGCDLVADSLASGEDWVNSIKGAVLWGPLLNSTIDDQLPSPESRQGYIDNLAEQYETFISSDYFDSKPCISTLIKRATGNIRIARGSEDTNNEFSHVEMLAAIHKKSQPQYQTDYHSGISGLKHSVLHEEVTPVQLNKYYDCLFSPFPAK